MSGEPIVDPRTAEQIVEQAQVLRTVYTPEWTPGEGDRGLALIRIFARLMEIMIGRLNRVPEKHFLAFLDAAGVHLLPPRAARTPIRFTPTAGAKADGVVAAGTPVATAAQAGQAPLDFETEARLTVSRSQLVALVSHDPASDLYADRKSVLASNEKNRSEGFEPFAGADLIPHRLFLLHDTLFQIRHRTRLTLTFTLHQMAEGFTRLFREALKWTVRASDEEEIDITPPAGNVAEDTVARTITVVFDTPLLTGIEKTPVGGIDGPWLRAETTQALTPGNAEMLVESVTVSSEASDIPPQLAFFNAAPLDTTREFYPFGERPKTYDAFFLAVPEALSKKGSRVTLTPQYIKGVDGPGGVELTWEFWNGTGWATLGRMDQTGVADAVNDTYGFTDTTSAFTADAGAGIHVAFDCPEIKPVEVNGQKNYWLRIRITAGNYGEEAGMELTAAGAAKPPADRRLSDWTYTPESFEAPVVSRLPLSYAYQSAQSFTACRTENQFVLKPVDPAEPFHPFESTSESESDPACCLAFDAPFSPEAVSLFVAVEEKASSEGMRVVWEYWNGTTWANLGVQDGTRHFTQSGLVEFLGPENVEERELFGARGRWLRARLEQGDKSAVRALGFYPNTVWARNCVTLTDELLGSSTEAPGATFTLSRFPVLEGVRIEVREPELPSDEDLASLSAQEGEDALSPVSTGDGTSREYWVRWHRVDHFLFSGQQSRHYQVDWQSGRIVFGDGTRGMIPPAGHDNIRAQWYQAGGGAKGNVPRGTVAVLKRAIPFVDKAFNVDQAGGGSDVETVEQVKIRGPQAIKNRNRAITWEDFEWLAREASSEVARARCLSAGSREDAGKIGLIIVPRSDDPQPQPSQGLLAQVRDYVSTRSRRIATAELVMLGPKYVKVDIGADVTPERIEESDLVRRRVNDRLTSYLHPLRGGPEDNGWEFGRDVFVSEVSKLIEETEGVDHAENVSLHTMPDLKKPLHTVPVPEGSLVASGEHTITIKTTS